MDGERPLVWTDYPFDDLARALILELKIEPAPDSPNDINLATVYARLHYSDAPGDVYQTPTLAFNRRVKLQYRFANGEELAGWLIWSDQLRTSRSEQIMGHVRVIDPSGKRDWRYEGYLLEFGPSVFVPQPPDPGPDPSPDPDPDQNRPSVLNPPPQPDVELDTPQTRLSADELFPYLYIQPWPAPDERVLDRAFVTMPSALVEDSKFMQGLANPKTQGDPVSRRQQAVDFINAAAAPKAKQNKSNNTTSKPGDEAEPKVTDEDEGQDPNEESTAVAAQGFVNNIKDLDSVFRYFPHLWALLSPPNPPSFDMATQVVTKAFGGWAGCKKTLEASSLAPDLAQVWASFCALNLVLGYRHDLLAQLIRILIMHHCLDRLADFMTAPLPPLDPKAGPEAPAIEEKRRLLTASDKKSAESKVDSEKKEADGEDASTEKTKTSTASGGEHAPPPTPALDEMMGELLAATIVLPNPIFTLFSPAPGDPIERWIEPYALGAARAVRSTPVGYELGEVQRIENVLRGETREFSNRNLTRWRSETEAQQDDTQTTSRREELANADLIHQVQKTLGDHVTKTSINNYDTTYGMPTTNKMGVNGEWWVQEQPAGGYLQDTARFARDVMDKTVKRIAQEVRRSRLDAETTEFESRAVSRFENVGGANDIHGVYRWVNRAFRLETHNLGERLILEIVIDDPAKNLIRDLARDYRLDVRPPRSPSDRGIPDYSLLTDDPAAAKSATPKPVQNAQDQKTTKPDSEEKPSVPVTKPVYYLDAFEWFDAGDDLPAPPTTQIVGRGLRSHAPLAEVRATIPKGYSPKEITVSVTALDPAATIEVVAGTQNLTSSGTGKGGPQTFTGTLSEADVNNDGEVEEVWIAVLCKPSDAKPDTSKDPGSAGANNAGSAPDPEVPVADTANVPISYYAANVSITCHRTAQATAEWRYHAYRKIRDGYDAQLKAYRGALQQRREWVQEENPQFLVNAVNHQIIQACIDALYQQHRALTVHEEGPFPAPQGGVLPPDLGAPRVTQYLRNTLLWSELSAQTYFGDDGPNDAALSVGDAAMMEALAPTTQFLNFLSARRARVLVPVRPEAKQGMLYFLRTGQIWPDEDALTPCMTADEALIAHIKADSRKTASAEEPVEDAWIVKIPTSMVMLAPTSDLASEGDVR